MWGVTPQALRKIISKSKDNKNYSEWRNGRLLFRNRISGKGYELFFQKKINQRKDNRTDIVLLVKNSGPKGSRERGKAIRSLLSSGATCDGRLLTERTIRSWLKADEERGLLAGVRQSRSDRGQSRVIAWRAWDRVMDSVDVPTERQQEIAAKIDLRVRSLWGSGASSVRKIQMFMEHFCRDLALSAGLEAADPRLNMICRVPKNYISKPSRARASKLVHKKRTDAGGYASDIEPRIRRTRDGLLPMDMVSADVRHCDFLVRRQDGSITTAKMVAFQDLATNRLFVRSFICPKGEAIRREHVLATMQDMFADPSWGVPKHLYFDNGGEFQTGAATDDLARLATLIRDVGRDILIGDVSSLEGGIQRSLPYNPQSKVIEGVFSNITRTIEPMLPGFVGGDRMKKKVENQGKAPAPMPGNEAAVHEAIRNEIEFYNAAPQQKGYMPGFSPNTKMAEFIQHGWKAITFNPDEFSLAFGPEVTRLIQTGGVVSINNRRFRHDDMMLRVGEKMRFRLPLLENGTRIVALDDHDRPLFVALEERAFHMLDRAGASEQARQSKVLNKAIGSDAAGLEKIDLAAEMVRYTTDNPASRPAYRKQKSPFHLS